MNNRISRLKILFNTEIKKKMMEKFGFTNIHQVPKITKVVLSMGFNNSRDHKKNQKDLSLIAGQYAVLTKARRSISQFSIREGAINGAMVTVRGNNMFHLIDRIINIGLLNWRNFLGLSNKSFNVKKYVSYSFGIKDTRIFPEISSDKMQDEGFNITIVSTCRTPEELRFIMKELDFPFRRDV